MKYYFSEYMMEACRKHQLVRHIDGTTAKIQFTCPTGNNLTVSYDELDTNKRAFVRGNLMYPPISRDGRQQFMNMVMHFNAESIQVMNMGLMPDPADERAMCPTWFVPRQKQTPMEWDKQMQVFELLAERSYDSLNGLLVQWVHSLH